MAYQSLYRKYRPATFDDIVGQNHITRTLQNALATNQLAHAYLFVGPRGTGKTTTARILAKALFCECGAPTPEPDGTCEHCREIAEGNFSDVIELDAASRTGVENVRDEIISRVHFAPALGASKVYIIDEVHMLSTGAFNAMLKTLEEPPDHVVFVLCTTHPQKVPQTIKSRCQQFDFHPINIEDISQRLSYIAQSEGVQVESGALPLIAKYADGGMRDAITALEQLISFSGDEITVDDVEGMLGEIDTKSLATLAAYVADRDVLASLQWVKSQIEVGADLVEITRSLQEYLRDMYVLVLLGVSGGIIDRTADEIEVLGGLAERFTGPEHIARLLDLLDEAMTTMRRSTNPRLVLEMVLIRATRPEGDLTLQALSQRIESLEKSRPSPELTQTSAEQMQPSTEEESTAPAKTEVTDAAPTSAAPWDQARAEQVWRIVLTRIREKSPSRYPLFVDTTASFKEDRTLLITYRPDQSFRMKQAGERANLTLVTTALHEATGTDITVNLAAGDEVVHAPVAAIDVKSRGTENAREEPEEPLVEELETTETFSGDEPETAGKPSVEQPVTEATAPTEQPVTEATSPTEQLATEATPPTEDTGSDPELHAAIEALGATLIDVHDDTDTAR